MIFKNYSAMEKAVIGDLNIFDWQFGAKDDKLVLSEDPTKRNDQMLIISRVGIRPYFRPAADFCPLLREGIETANPDKIYYALVEIYQELHRLKVASEAAPNE